MKTTSEEGFSSSWSREQEKAFENALAIHFENCEGRWEKIADFVNGKSPDEIKHHYDLLVEDINGIESGRVPLPPYVSSLDDLNEDFNESEAGKRNVNFGSSHGDSSGKGSRSEQERRKGIAWTEDEHRLFLLGLEKYGKGDWRSISRNFVVSRTPTQVASHAQKYFIRLNSMNKDRRRSSIHDITNVNSGEASVSQGPITGQSNVQPGSVGKSSKPYSQPPNLTGLGHYGSPTIGQPIPGSLVSAIGTPINLPTPAHMSYGIHGTIPGLVPGAPMINPLSYPMQGATSHR